MLAILLASTGTSAIAVDPRLPKRIEQANVGRDGATAQIAYRVERVAEEYRIARALAVKPQSQALVEQDGKTFNVLTGIDSDGNERELWFDISTFLGAETDLITKAPMTGPYGASV